jgi:ABC-type transport system involved in cytochrome c biogenesis ATPase subunit
MRVLEIQTERFMALAPTRIRFPRSGVVLITGGNGASKTSLLEAIAVGLYGKTLRGTPWWPAGALGSSAVVVTDLVEARRVRKGDRVSLAWRPNGNEPAGRALLASRGLEGASMDEEFKSYETATQAQEALSAVIGTFDSWRRSSCFSADDAQHFSGATDAERKRLLEAMLGLDRFDAALEACRADLRTFSDLAVSCASIQDTLQRERDVLRARLTQYETELARALEDLVVLVCDELPRGRSSAALRVPPSDAMVAAALKDARALDAIEAEAIQAVGRVQSDLVRARRAVGLFASGRCPTCGADAVGLCDDHAAEVDRALVAEQEAAYARNIARADAEEARWLLSALQQRRVEHTVAEDKFKTAAIARGRANGRVREYQEGVDRLKEELEASRVAWEDAAHNRAQADQRVQLLRAAEAVLGLRGFRAHLLADNLAGLSAVANAWLPRLGMPDIRVKLHPYTEKKSGGVLDSISLDVAGVGDGYGYRAASSGERRRIDVAILLALAEVGQAAAAQTGSTLCFDEVFDRLDSTGIAALMGALEDLARDRVVLLVTHNEEVARGVRAAMTIRMDAGVATVSPEQAFDDAGDTRGG